MKRVAGKRMGCPVKSSLQQKPQTNNKRLALPLRQAGRTYTCREIQWVHSIVRLFRRAADLSLRDLNLNRNRKKVKKHGGREIYNK